MQCHNSHTRLNRSLTWGCRLSQTVGLLDFHFPFLLLLSFNYHTFTARSVIKWRLWPINGSENIFRNAWQQSVRSGEWVEKRENFVFVRDRIGLALFCVSDGGGGSIDIDIQPMNVGQTVTSMQCDRARNVSTTITIGFRFVSIERHISVCAFTCTTAFTTKANTFFFSLCPVAHEFPKDVPATAEQWQRIQISEYLNMLCHGLNHAKCCFESNQFLCQRNWWGSRGGKRMEISYVCTKIYFIWNTKLRSTKNTNQIFNL